ncbi:MAG: hypothetical protein ACREJ0_21585, partial [Geminicoccaceae bacterium]
MNKAYARDTAGLHQTAPDRMTPAGPVLRRRDDGYEVSDDPSRLDIDTIHGFLRTAYWSPGVSRETVERAAAGSVPMGLYAPSGAQAGYARAVTDRATFGYLADVFVLPEHRGRG